MFNAGFLLSFKVSMHPFLSRPSPGGGVGPKLCYAATFIHGERGKKNFKGTEVIDCGAKRGLVEAPGGSGLTPKYLGCADEWKKQGGKTQEGSCEPPWNPPRRPLMTQGLGQGPCRAPWGPGPPEPTARASAVSTSRPGISSSLRREGSERFGNKFG